MNALTPIRLQPKPRTPPVGVRQPGRSVWMSPRRHVGDCALLLVKHRANCNTPRVPRQHSRSYARRGVARLRSMHSAAHGWGAVFGAGLVRIGGKRRAVVTTSIDHPATRPNAWRRWSTMLNDVGAAAHASVAAWRTIADARQARYGPSGRQATSATAADRPGVEESRPPPPW